MNSNPIEIWAPKLESSAARLCNHMDFLIFPQVPSPEKHRSISISFNKRQCLVAYWFCWFQSGYKHVYCQKTDWMKRLIKLQTSGRATRRRYRVELKTTSGETRRGGVLVLRVSLRMWFQMENLLFGCARQKASSNNESFPCSLFLIKTRRKYREQVWYYKNNLSFRRKFHELDKSASIYF